MVETGIACSNCEHLNPASGRFCAGCGGSLWEPCLVCDHELACGEMYCGRCGTNIQQKAEELLASGKRKLATAQADGESYRFQEAIATLHPLTRQEHPRLEAQAALAHRRIKELREQRDRLEQAATADLAEGRRLVESRQYEQAVRILEATPTAFRSDEHERLRKDAARHAGARESLEADIIGAFKRRETAEASVLLEQLLRLDPDHEKGRILAAKLRDHLLGLAKKRRDEFQHEEALESLHRVPLVARDERWERERDTATELDWLNRFLRQEPLADAILLAIARRLANATPDDARAVKLHQQLRTRVAEKPGEGHRIAWAKPPVRTTLNAPVDLMPRLTGLELSAPDRGSAWREQQDCLAVACGLALQAVGAGEIATNLRPVKKSLIGSLAGDKASVLNPFGGFSRKRERAAWGLDLGAHSLKAVQVRQLGDQVQVTDFAVLEHEAANSGESHDSWTATLAKWKEQAAVTDDHRVAVNLPGIRVMTKWLALPPMDTKRRAQALEHEIRHQVPLPLDELCWDRHVAELDCQDSSHSPAQCLLIAARQREVESRIALFEDQGLSVAIVQPEAVAIHNLIAHQGRHATERTEAASLSSDDGCLVAVDIGSSATQLSIHWSGNTWFRTVPCGGDEVNATLCRAFNLTRDQADDLKREPHRARVLSKLFAELDGGNERLGTHIRQSIEAFSRECPDRTIGRVVLAGGGARLRGLLRYLRFGPLL